MTTPRNGLLIQIPTTVKQVAQEGSYITWVDSGPRTEWKLKVRSPSDKELEEILRTTPSVFWPLPGLTLTTTFTTPRKENLIILTIILAQLAQFIQLEKLNNKTLARKYFP